MIQINLFTKHKQTHRLIEWIYDCWGESWGKRIFREFGTGWMKHKLESRLPGEISITSDMQMTPSYGRKWRTKEPLVKVKEESEKVGFKLNIQKTKIMASGPITSWQIDEKQWKQLTLFWGPPKSLQMVIAAMKLKDSLLLGRKVMTNLDSILKSRDITLPTKVHLVNAVVFPVVMYGCESWTIKKAECQRIDAFGLWCWRRLLRVPWAASRSDQSILKKISPEYPLEGLMLKLILQYFSHLMWKTDSFEKTLMLGSIEGRRKGDYRGWDGWMTSLTQWRWVWVDSGSWWWPTQGGLACLGPWGCEESDMSEQLNWTQGIYCYI